MQLQAVGLVICEIVHICNSILNKTKCLLGAKRKWKRLAEGYYMYKLYKYGII